MKKPLHLFLQLLLLTTFLTVTTLLNIQAQAQPKFKVLAFYNGTWDAAHIDFIKEANVWFPQLAGQNGFSWESTTNWSLLNSTNLSNYQVVMFLDGVPPAAQRPAFEQYMRNGGGWIGFHVCAFNTDPAGWDWYHNQFLGTGAFKSNTWGPTTAVLKCEHNTHPSTVRLPTTFTSAVSEWYSWNNDLRTNPNIQILCSIDPSSFPLGTDPNQSWYEGYYPVIWTNKNYKMLYANFGHNDMDYSTNTGKSSTFASEIQNRFLLDGLLWLGGVTANPTTIPGAIQAENYNNMSGIQKENTTDSGGGENVGWIDGGDWIDYNVNVQTSGTYDVQYRVASLNGGGSISLRKGASVLATTSVPRTDGWQNWRTITATVNLTTGNQTLRLHAEAGGFNINWLNFVSGNVPPTVSISSPVNNASFRAPAAITIQANALDSDGTISQVAFYNGSTLIGTDATTPFSFSWNNVAAGNYGITARATDNRGSTTTSATINITVAPSSGAPIGQTITLRGNNDLFVSGLNGTAPMQCTSTAANSTEKFLVVDAGNGKIGLRSMNKYVSSENGAPSGINCNRTAMQGWEVFDWVIAPDGKISLRGNNGLYVSSENGTKAMTCTRQAIGGWELFTYSISTASRLSPENKEIEGDAMVFPNPFNNLLKYTLPAGIKNHSIAVYDLHGKRHKSLFIKNTATEHSLDLTTLPDGIYILSISSQGYQKKIRIKK